MSAISNFTYGSERLETSRVIRHLKGKNPGPKVIFIAGMHGNEPSGVVALQEALGQLKEEDINGEIIGLVGNLKALEVGRRFIDSDLNRLWTVDRVNAMLAGTLNGEMERAESKEQFAIWKTLEAFINSDQPTYFIDLHTTSSDSPPFMSISRTERNVTFAKRFDVPAILGIEDHIQGPLLDYMSIKGHVSVAFEAGQHVSPDSQLNHEKFVCAVLAELNMTSHALNCVAFEESGRVYEIVYRHEVLAGSEFVMKPGYENFQAIEAGEELADDKDGPIAAPMAGQIFMPLYQKEGSDGFFIIQ